MRTMLLSMAGSLALATTLVAQPPTPATQPVRPPDRPPTGEPTPTPTRPMPEGERGADDDGPLTGRATPEDGDPEVATVTLKGCLERVDAKGYRLRPVQDNDATVTKDVRLEGAVDALREHVGRLVEVRGTYEQGTPATTDPFFSVTRVRQLAGECSAR